MIFYKKQPAPIPQQPAAPTLSPQQQIPFFATSIGASIDAFYRSAMNSLLNARLTNNKQGALFPNMHIQLPVRVMYLNGIKNLRVYIDHHKQSLLKAGSDKRLTELGLACIPGLAMTPFSSILEASNAGHMASVLIIMMFYIMYYM